MSDLLAKCDWHGDELRVELPQWPEVITVWVDGKAMPYAPVVADVRSLQAENAKLRRERDMYSDLVGMMDHPDINAQLNAENEKLRVELTDLRLKSCPSCGIKVENEKLREQLEYALQTSRARLETIDRLKADNAQLRELVKDMWRFTGAACKKYPRLFDQSAQGGQMVMPNMLDSFEQRMAELGIGVE